MPLETTDLQKHLADSEILRGRSRSGEETSFYDVPNDRRVLAGATETPDILRVGAIWRGWGTTLIGVTGNGVPGS